MAIAPADQNESEHLATPDRDSTLWGSGKIAITALTTGPLPPRNHVRRHTFDVRCSRDQTPVPDPGVRPFL